jgi:hypothetical protein
MMALVYCGADVTKNISLYCEENVRSGEMIRKACRIERLNDQRLISTERLWLEFPTLLPAPSMEDMESFLIMMLLPAMAEGRNVYVEGLVSERLLSNLSEFQEYWHGWRPDLFRRIEFNTTGTLPPLPVSGARKGAVLGYSGGVDSAFSVWRHARKQADYRSRTLRYCSFVHGFDIPLLETDAYHSAFSMAAETLQSLDIPLIPVRTNCRDVIRLNWEMWFGPALAAVLQLFKQECDVGLIASGVPYTAQVSIWGSNSITDPLLSTAGFEIEHDGAGYNREMKITEIARWEAGRSNLRVCWKGKQKDRNCGKCEKCIRTMLAFAVNRLPIPSCFPQAPKVTDIIKIRLSNPFMMDDWLGLLRVARQNKIGFRLSSAILYVIVASRLRSGIRWRVKAFLKTFRKD